MYKLTLGSINELKASSSAEHGVFSGTIETDRVALVGDNGFLQVDGNYGDHVIAGLTRTFSKTLDEKAIYFICEEKESENLNTADLYAWDGELYLKSDFASIDKFIEFLVDEGKIEIQGYDNPVYELDEATIKDAGAGYEDEEVVVEIPGRPGDTLGKVTCTVTIEEGEASGSITAVEITEPGEYAVEVTSQDIEVPGGSGVITVKMAKA